MAARSSGGCAHRPRFFSSTSRPACRAGRSTVYRGTTGRLSSRTTGRLPVATTEVLPSRRNLLARIGTLAERVYKTRDARDNRRLIVASHPQTAPSTHSHAMSTEKKSLFVTDDGKNLMFTFILVSSLFLLWGICNGMIDVMDKHFQNELHLTSRNRPGCSSRITWATS